MDIVQYDRLRQKRKSNDYEGKNKVLDKWLFGTSFFGNIGSIFFAYFLLYPALKKSFVVNVGDNLLALVLSAGFSIVFLIIFEVIKRYIVKNFFNDLIWQHNYKIKTKTISWLIVVCLYVAASFYFSMMGSKNFATTIEFESAVQGRLTTNSIDSLRQVFELRKQPLIEDNTVLRSYNNDLRERLINTPENFITARRGYQESINSNSELITANQQRIDYIEQQYNNERLVIIEKQQQNQDESQRSNRYNILLFVVIVAINESLIIFGIYFRERFENKLYVINKDKYEKTYLLRDRYKVLLKYIYNNGEVSVGERVVAGTTLKELIASKTVIQNPNKFVDEFLINMDRLGVFQVNGKRRFIGIDYEQAVEIINNFDDTLRVFDELK